MPLPCVTWSTRMMFHMCRQSALELDLRNRGTEIIKGPEMLELDFASRRDSKGHDRRKRVGTSKASLKRSS